MNLSFYFLVLIVFLAHATEALSGFGSAILSIALGAQFYPVEFLLPVLLPLNILLSLYIVARYPEGIDRTLIIKKIFPFMGAGFITGMMMFHLLQGGVLKKCFGAFILLVSLREILNARKPETFSVPNTESRNSNTASFAGIFGAGIMHGLYASGGPLLVYSLSRISLDKKSFRSTLSVVWLVLNVILAASFYYTGKMNHETLRMSALLFPTLPLGILTGELLHHRVNENSFRLFIFSILFFAGLSLLAR